MPTNFLEEFATMFTSLRKDCSLLTCFSDDHQDDIHACSQELANAFTHLLKDCSLLTCVSNDNQDDSGGSVHVVCVTD